MTWLKAEIITLLVLAGLVALLDGGGMASSFSQMGNNEIYLAFSLIFTFVAGMEVLR